MYCFPRFLEIVQTPTLISRGFPELHSFLICQSPTEIYWHILFLIHLLPAEPENWAVICFQIILFPDRPMRFWMFNKGLLTLCVMPEIFRSSTSGWRKWKCVVSTTATHTIRVNSWPGVWSFITPEDLSSRLGSVSPWLPLCALCCKPEQSKRGKRQNARGLHLTSQEWGGRSGYCP